MTQLDTSDSLEGLFFQVVAGVVVVVLHLCFLFSLSPGSSIWRELTRLGGRAWKGLRLLLFLPVGSGEGPNWSLRSDASRNPVVLPIGEN